MKKSILFFLTSISILSCNQNPVNKPNNFIEESKMEEIIYDLAVLEGARSQMSSNGYALPSAKDFLKKKYKVDSLTYVQNTQYYAADIDNFKHLYDRVKNRLEEENANLTKGNSVNTPKSSATKDVGIVK